MFLLKTPNCVHVASPIVQILVCKFHRGGVLDMKQNGIQVNGANINNFRYSGDTVLEADSSESLQELVSSLTIVSREYGLELHTRMAIMAISKNPIPHK